MKRFIIIMITSLLFIEGCQVNTYPEVPAFEDEFTREFLPSKEEVEEGYYLFESKTGGYQMLFPENAKISEFDYKINGEGYEFVRLTQEKNGNGVAVSQTYIYDFNGIENFDRNLSLRLDALSDRIGYQGNYQKIETTDKDIYYAHNTHNFEVDNNSHSVYRTFGYIVPKKGMFALGYIHASACREVINCSFDLEKQKEDAFKMMKSVRFN